MRKVIYYKTENGKKPVKEFIDSLDEKHALKIFWVLKFLQETDNIRLVPAEYFKYLTDGIYEVRAKVGRNAFRILCFFENGNLIVATNGFKKKSQKTPKQEIKLAVDRRKIYLKRKKNNG